MEKSDKVFWSYIAVALVFFEICIDIFLNQNPSHWDSIRAAFIILNAVIMGYLLYLRNKKENLNPQSS
jgi:hypothetical protein